MQAVGAAGFGALSEVRAGAVAERDEGEAHLILGELDDGFSGLCGGCCQSKFAARDRLDVRPGLSGRRAD